MPAPSHRQNNLDAVRLVAAVAVLVGHAWPLTARDDAPRIGGVLLTHLAVYVFFSVSGYLIATSWRSSPHVVGYLRRRIARIFPALVVTIAVTILVLGPLASTLSAARYFADPLTWRYLSGLVLAPSYALPGVFRDNPTTAVNGSLWTLGPEFLCYLLVLAIGLGMRALPERARAVAHPVGFAFVGALLAAAFVGHPDHGVRESAGAMVFFLIGAVVAQIGIRRLPLWPVVPLVAAWLLAGTVSRDVGVAGAWVALPYTVLALGLRRAPVAHAAGRFGDFSYGIYLWAFPLQQVVVLLLPGLPLAADVAIVLAITAVAAAASWYAVERHALAWARR